MSNTLPIMINDRDVSPLFDPSVPAIPFSAPRVNEIPAPGSIIYTVWRDQIDFIYVGIGGVGQSADTPLEKRNPRSRIVQHSSGRRSGDQFCVYVHDFYVIPDLIVSGKYTPDKGLLDRMTKEYIHSHLHYRYMVFQSDDSSRIVRDLETTIQRGVVGIGKPFLNPKS